MQQMLDRFGQQTFVGGKRVARPSWMTRSTPVP
jgi:hypothetical protein